MRQLISFIDLERVRQQLTQNELAERSGLGSGTISRILSLQTTPSLSTLECLAKALGYDFISFLALASGNARMFQDHEIMKVFEELSGDRRKVLLEIAHSLLEVQEREKSRAAE